MLRKIFLSLLLAALFTAPALAQSGSGSLSGTVTDGANGDPLPFVNVVLFLNGNQITGGTTDFDGKYTIKPIQPGTYDVLYTFVGYTTKKITGIVISSNKITFQNAALNSGIELEAVEVVEYSVPLIDKDGGSSGQRVSREEIAAIPTRSVTGIVATTAGVNSEGGVRGARSSSTWYYMDGIKMRGSTALPKSAIEEVAVITGGIPASIGDATGGVVNISLRGASAQYSGGVEYITSGYKVGEEAYGLDKFGYNLVEGSLSGPILVKKDSLGNKQRPVLGFFFSGNYTNVVDGSPTNGVYKMKDDVRDNLLASPLRQNISETGQVNGTLYEADFLGPDDFETIKTRRNVGGSQANFVGKLDFNLSETQYLTLGGTANLGKSNGYSYAGSLMNWENNVQSKGLDWRTWAKYSQRFVNEEDESEASNLKNVYYSVMIDYTRSSNTTQDEDHGDNFFRYGHVGEMEVYQRNAYQYDETAQVYKHVGFEDTLVTFEATPYNPTLAAINNQYFNLFDEEPYNPRNPGPYSTLINVQNGKALLNGSTPQSTYNLWSYYGTPGGSYAVSEQNQFRVSASGSADIGSHAIQLGFEYEQRRDASFGLSPVGLWTLARLYSNSHIKELDRSDSTYYNDGTDYYVDYERLVGSSSSQFEFDYRLRESLGLDPRGNDYINTDALDPDQLSLDMFGADDLLNQGNSAVSYFGYDYHGNKTNRRATLDDFFNETNELGKYTRPINAYEPIYIAGYVMDKFAFDDIIFNVGVRVDRFDANQPVPIDPFVIGEALTAKEVTSVGNETVSHPSNIGDTYVVYVDDVDSPNAIVGYRDGQTWYDKTGAVVEDPYLIASTNGYPTPYMKNGADAPLTQQAFKDYDPQVNVMPRVAFSFPISDEALFFAHYDVLVQRPTSSNQFNPINYLYIESQNSLISNPDLKPEKTIDYALGFQQVLSKSSSIKLEGFYREQRDMIQVRNFTGAYPRPYRAYGNLDFGTVKGLTVTYDLRRTGNLWMKIGYTLQFADGTGSSTGSALALINAGLPNLRTVAPFDYDQRHRINANIDYRYGSGSDYNGPIWFNKQVFANTGVNLVAIMGSGTPYTKSRNPYPITGEVSPNTEGSINGSRLPWQFNMNMNIDKNIPLVFGKEDKQRPVNLNIYLWVSNLLNTKNVQSVYRYTGVTDDDGYLSAAEYQQNINSQNSPASFSNYYSMYVKNPYNISSPRTIRLGARLDF